MPLASCFRAGVAALAGVGQRDFGVAAQRHQLLCAFEAVLPRQSLPLTE